MSDMPRDRERTAYFEYCMAQVADRTPWLLSDRRETTPPPKHVTPGRLGPSATFVREAPNQPRVLRPQEVPDRGPGWKLELRIDISSSPCHCRLAFGGLDLRSTALRPQQLINSLVGAGVFAKQPADDIDDVLSLAEAFVEERLVLLRFIRIGEIGHGSGPKVIASDFAATPVVPTQTLPPHVRFEEAAEVILYSWTGASDRHLVPPRYGDFVW